MRSDHDAYDNKDSLFHNDHHNHDDYGRSDVHCRF
jgi:hypothetical protein